MGHEQANVLTETSLTYVLQTYATPNIHIISTEYERC